MPVHSIIHKQHHLVLTIGEGQVTFWEIKAHQDRLLSDPDFDESFNQLIDATAVTDLDLSGAQAKEIALRRIFSTKSRRAFIAKRPHVFGIGRIMEVYQEQHAHVEVQVFSEIDAALRWLGLPSGLTMTLRQPSLESQEPDSQR